MKTSETQDSLETAREPDVRADFILAFGERAVNSDLFTGSIIALIPPS